MSEHRASIIDNIYTNATNANLTGGNILTQITDHFPQFLILKNTQISHIKSESFKYDYSKFKEDKFLEDFNQIDFTYLESNDMGVSTKFDRFLKDLSTLTNKHAPIKKRSRKEIRMKDKPWINSRIQKMMRIRDRVLLKPRSNVPNISPNIDVGEKAETFQCSIEGWSNASNISSNISTCPIAPSQGTQKLDSAHAWM